MPVEPARPVPDATLLLGLFSQGKNKKKQAAHVANNEGLETGGRAGGQGGPTRYRISLSSQEGGDERREENLVREEEEEEEPALVKSKMRLRPRKGRSSRSPSPRTENKESAADEQPSPPTATTATTTTTSTTTTTQPGATTASEEEEEDPAMMDDEDDTFDQQDRSNDAGSCGAGSDTGNTTSAISSSRDDESHDWSSESGSELSASNNNSVEIRHSRNTCGFSRLNIRSTNKKRRRPKNAQTDPFHYTRFGYVVYSKSQRIARVQRYREKRRRNNPPHKYVCRQKFAASRKRINGRFVTKEVEKTLKESKRKYPKKAGKRSSMKKPRRKEPHVKSSTKYESSHSRPRPTRTASLQKTKPSSTSPQALSTVQRGGKAKPSQTRMSRPQTTSKTNQLAPIVLPLQHLSQASVDAHMSSPQASAPASTAPAMLPVAEPCLSYPEVQLPTPATTARTPPPGSLMSIRALPTPSNLPRAPTPIRPHLHLPSPQLPSNGRPFIPTSLGVGPLLQPPVPVAVGDTTQLLPVHPVIPNNSITALGMPPGLINRLTPAASPTAGGAPTQSITSFSHVKRSDASKKLLIPVEQTPCQQPVNVYHIPPQQSKALPYPTTSTTTAAPCHCASRPLALSSSTCGPDTSCSAPALNSLAQQPILNPSPVPLPHLNILPYQFPMAADKSLPTVPSSINTTINCSLPIVTNGAVTLPAVSPKHLPGGPILVKPSSPRQNDTKWEVTGSQWKSVSPRSSCESQPSSSCSSTSAFTAANSTLSDSSPASPPAVTPVLEYRKFVPTVVFSDLCVKG